MSEDYVRFRSEVRGFYFPSCPDCDLRESCNLRERNEDAGGGTRLVLIACGAGHRTVSMRQRCKSE